jgi:hypothetical protein
LSLGVTLTRRFRTGLPSAAALRLDFWGPSAHFDQQSAAVLFQHMIFVSVDAGSYLGLFLF